MEHDYLDEIDAQVRRYTRAATQKVENLTNRDQNVRGNLNALLSALSRNQRMGDFVDRIQPVFQLYEQSFLSEKSLWYRKRPGKRAKAAPVIIQETSPDEDAAAQAAQLLRSEYGRASDQRTRWNVQRKWLFHSTDANTPEGEEKMNFDFICSATSKELEQFKSVCNQLLSRTYVVRTLYRPGKGRVNNPDYSFLSLHYEAIQEYLSLLDWDLRKDDLNGYFYVINTDEANRCNLSKKETAILLALRMIYEENQERLGLEQDAICTVCDVLEKVVTAVSYTHLTLPTNSLV